MVPTLRPSTEYVLILTTDCLLVGTWYAQPLGFKTPVSFGQIMLINLRTQLFFRMAHFCFRQMTKFWIKGVYSFLDWVPTHITPTSCPVRLRSQTGSKIAIFCVRRRCAGYETIRHSSGISVLIHIRVTRGRSGKSVSVSVHVTVDAWRFENTTAWRVSVTVKRWRCHRWVVVRGDARRVNVVLFLIYWRRLTRLSSGMWLWAWWSVL